MPITLSQDYLRIALGTAWYIEIRRDCIHFVAELLCKDCLLRLQRTSFVRSYVTGILEEGPIGIEENGTGGWHTLSHFSIDVPLQLDDTTPVHQR